MNLHAIASPYVAAVNPWLTVLWEQSIGYVANASGKRAAQYAAAVRTTVQWQALEFSDLKQVEGLNINGVKQAMYINGNIEGVSRPDARGGDLITLPDKSVWLVVLVLEDWVRTAGWTKAAVVLQNNA